MKSSTTSDFLELRTIQIEKRLEEKCFYDLDQFIADQLDDGASVYTILIHLDIIKAALLADVVEDIYSQAEE